jgi:hypothetical protein
MTLTEKEIATLKLFNAKKEIYEYVEVKVLGIGGVGAKAKKENPVMKMVEQMPELTLQECEDIREASVKRQMKNL